MSKPILKRTTANYEIEYVTSTEHIKLWGTDDGAATLDKADALQLIKTLCSELNITKEELLTND
jgi:hypothetical protein